MAAETKQSYLNKVVRSGARTFFSPARRPPRLAYAPPASASAPDKVTHEVGPAATAGATPIAEPAAVPEAALGAASGVAEPSEFSASSDAAAPLGSFGRPASSAPPPSGPGDAARGSVEARPAGEPQASEREATTTRGGETARGDVSVEAATQARRLDASLAPDVSSAPPDVSSALGDKESIAVIRPRGLEAEIQDATSPEGFAGAARGDDEDADGAAVRPAFSSLAGVYERAASQPAAEGETRPAWEAHEAVAVPLELQAEAESEAATSQDASRPARHADRSPAEGNGPARDATATTQGDTTVSTRGSASRTHLPTRAVARSEAQAHAQERGRQVEPGERDEEGRREAEAAPLVQHTRGETIVRLPRLPGRASRSEQRAGDLTVALGGLEDLRATFTGAAGASSGANADRAAVPPSSRGGIERVSPFGASEARPAGTVETRAAGGSGPRPGAGAVVNPASRERTSNSTAEHAPVARPHLAREATRNALSPAAAKGHLSAEGKGFAAGDSTHSNQSARPGQPNQPARPGEPGQPARPGVSGQMARAGDPSPASSASRARQARASGDARGARRADAGELLPAEPKRPRVGEGVAGRESAAGGGAPRVTVGRLDVRVVNQTPPKPAPTPAPKPPAPASKGDGWESLDRGHLGRLFLL